jgi:hypothetical protein
MVPQLYHLAQVNIARMLAPLTDPIMEEFVARLDEINALADQSPGFVWRLQGEAGDAPATYLRPYDDDRILFNLSVWESIEQLKEYAYKTAHGEVMRQRQQWFEKLDSMFQAMWWVEAGHIPTIAEAKQRLEYIQKHGETAHAFTFKRPFLPAELTEENLVAFPLCPCQAG